MVILGSLHRMEPQFIPTILVHAGDAVRTANQTARRSVTLPATVADSVRSMANARQLSANRMRDPYRGSESTPLVDRIQPGSAARRLIQGFRTHQDLRRGILPKTFPRRGQAAKGEALWRLKQIPAAALPLHALRMPATANDIRRFRFPFAIGAAVFAPFLRRALAARMGAFVGRRSILCHAR